MKKIISMLSIVAMIISMMSTVAFASGNNLYWELVEDESEGKIVTYNLVVDAVDALDKVSATFDVSGILNSGVTFVAENVCGGTFNAGTNTAKVFSITYQTAGASFNGKVVLFKVKFDFTNATVDSIKTPLKNNRQATAMMGTTSYTLTNTAITQDLKPVGGKPVEMDTPIAGNDMYGKKTALTKISFKNVANPVVELYKDEVKSDKTYELPSGVAGGTTDIIGIIRYAADETGTFTLKVLDGTTEVARTSYVAQ